LGRSAKEKEKRNRVEVRREKAKERLWANVTKGRFFRVALLPYFFARRFSRCAPTN